MPIATSAHHWSWVHVSGFELFGCVHRHARAHWLERFACKYLAWDEELAKDKELAAYGILFGYPTGTWVFPFAPDLTTIRVCRFM